MKKILLCVCAICLAVVFTDNSMADTPVVQCGSERNIGWFACIDITDGSFKWAGESANCGMTSDDKIGRGANHKYATKATCKISPDRADYVVGANCNYNDHVTPEKLPELVGGQHVLRCVATECTYGYSLKDGYCQKNKEQEAKTEHKKEENKGDVKEKAKGGDGSCGCITYWDGADELKKVNGPHIIVTFETRKTDICKCAAKEVEKFLKSQQDINEIHLIGSADTQMSKENADLSINRAKAVGEMIKRFEGTNYANVTWTAGDTAQRGDKVKETNQPKYRSVTIIVVQKHVSSICEESDVRRLLADTRLNNIDGIERLRAACGKNLGNDEVVKIMKELARNPIVQGEYPTVGVYGILYDIEKDVSAWNLKTSVWKNKEGKFNTARLVSDATAGVVLGTVGSIITSKIIKKNQVKQGFEDLRCVIGGQDVANWGDEFRVGIVTDLK